LVNTIKIEETAAQQSLFYFCIMKKILCCLALIAALIGCREEKEIKQYFSTGEVSRTHFEVDGKKHGKMTEFYNDGKVRGYRMFENDVQVGKSEFYYPSGKLKEVQYYDQGKLHGGDTMFYESGNLQFMRTFNHGKMDGYIRKWAEDGTVIFEAKYANDELVEVKGVPIPADSIIHKEPISKKEN
jgi:hypothetical protein